jgi:LacI family transcriptional regulator
MRRSEVAGSVTVKDVAREAQVSIGTVSRVFNNHINVTDEVRQRVLKAASQLGYFSVSGNADARSAEGGRALKEVGLLSCFQVASNPVIANPFWSHILYGVESEASRSNVKVTYRSISEIQHAPDLLLTTIYDMKLGGIVLAGPAEEATVRLIQETGVPMVLVDNFVKGVHCVLGNNLEGARAAVEYLIEMGHQRIVFIGGPMSKEQQGLNEVYTIERRAQGYRLALLDAGLPIRPELFEAGNLSTDGGYEACQRLLARKVEFSAIFCANDETAIGAMKALREGGYRIPEDVSLIGFDDIAMVEHLTPALTTVHVDKEALGSVAFKRLLTLISNPDPVSVTSVLEVELVKRDSVSPFKAS